MKNKLLLIILFLICFLPNPVVAEVMDKELSLQSIWLWAFWGSVIGVSFILFKRWLGVISLIIFGFILYGAISEWNDPLIGPAIARESGLNYGFHAYSALTILVVFHFVCWTTSYLKDRNKLNKTRTNA